MAKAPNFFTYFGGKYKQAGKLIKMFPEHICYVDVFGGAGNLIIQKPVSRVEIFNDINSDIVNLFRQLRDNGECLVNLLSLVPHSREELYHFRETYDAETDNLQKAVMFFTMLNQSFSGTPRGWTFSKVSPTANQIKNKVDKLYLITERLRDVSLENKDFAYVFERYDKDSTFFYCDPPYVPDTRDFSRNGYHNEMYDEDHERLVSILKDVVGKVMLSGYENDLYNSLGWEKYTFSVKQTAHLIPSDRTEVVWVNYDISEVL